mmetsp:Transcript_43813/g.121279  ORF Transcript_43813/g.121279 Transcript_43813/m.121279 type:complete len:212 (+) Transcript_43813:2771-3406(+)
MLRRKSLASLSQSAACASASSSCGWSRRSFSCIRISGLPVSSTPIQSGSLGNSLAMTVSISFLRSCSASSSASMMSSSSPFEFGAFTLARGWRKSMLKRVKESALSSCAASCFRSASSSLRYSGSACANWYASDRIIRRGSRLATSSCRQRCTASTTGRPWCRRQSSATMAVFPNPGPPRSTRQRPPPGAFLHRSMSSNTQSRVPWTKRLP